MGNDEPKRVFRWEPGDEGDRQAYEIPIGRFEAAESARAANRRILGEAVPAMAALLHDDKTKGCVQVVDLAIREGYRELGDWNPNPLQKALRRRLDATLHARLVLAREMLHQTGSLFFRATEGGSSLFRKVVFEVFGGENLVAEIAFATTLRAAGDPYPAHYDRLIWFAKDAKRLKARPLQLSDEVGWAVADGFDHILGEENQIRPFSLNDSLDQRRLLHGDRLLALDDLSREGPGYAEEFTFEGKVYRPEKDSWRTGSEGLVRLAAAGRLHATEGRLRYVRFLDDAVAPAATNVWHDTGDFSPRSKSDPETHPVVLARCLLMATDPGDLVLTTVDDANFGRVAEKLDRRWIVVGKDKSLADRVREPFDSAVFDLGRIVPAGEIPVIALESFADDERIDEIAADFTELPNALQELNESRIKRTPDAIPWEEGDVPTASVVVGREKTVEIGELKLGDRPSGTFGEAFDLWIGAMLALRQLDPVERDDMNRKWEIDEAEDVPYEDRGGTMEMPATSWKYLEYWRIKREPRTVIEAIVRERAPKKPFSLTFVNWPKEGESSFRVEHLRGV